MREENRNFMEEVWNFSMTSFRDVTDFWLASMNNTCWTQDQIENFITKAIDQGKVSREEGMKLMEELIARAKDTQYKFQEMVNEGVKSSLMALQVPSKTQLDELRKIIDDLAQKLDPKQ